MFAKQATLFAVIGLTHHLAAAGLLPRAPPPLNGVYYCDKLLFPDYDACDQIMAGIDWTTGDEGIKVADGQCAQFDVLQDNGTPANCMIQACNQRGDGASQPMNVFNGPTEYGLLKQWCKPDGAGGNAPDGGPVIVVALNNPEFQPPSSVKRATGGKIRAKTVTIEEHKAIVEKARQASVKPVPAPSSRLLKRKSWQNFGTSKNIRGDKRDRVSAVGGSGTSQQWSTSEGFSTSVTTTAEMGADFEIFSASVSISVTLEQSWTYTETITFDPTGRCEPAQDAVLYFYPLYDQYVGKFDDSDTTITIMVPVEGDNNYEMDVECLG